MNELLHQIMEFYRNEEMSRGFNNNHLSEIAAQSMIFARLERAAINEGESDSVNSRYYTGIVPRISLFGITICHSFSYLQIISANILNPSVCMHD